MCHLSLLQCVLWTDQSDQKIPCTALHSRMVELLTMKLMSPCVSVHINRCCFFLFQYFFPLFKAFKEEWLLLYINIVPIHTPCEQEHHCSESQLRSRSSTSQSNGLGAGTFVTYVTSNKCFNFFVHIFLFTVAGNTR